MSYLVLARKWRPQKFSDVAGQPAVVRTLQNSLKQNRVAHALLFSGVRGVGKTTIARIMAKAINCTGESSHPPCDKCKSCTQIKNGTSLDLHEIDGASNRGIQEIRDLKENIRFFPAENKFKIIIIDEVHMLTNEAFNALLKTLEEPPAHVYFMFATTELHKVPVTILSRCQRYQLKQVNFPTLVSFFSQIADREGINVSKSAMEIVAREASGSIRDGLSLLEQLFSFGSGNDDEPGAITENEVREVLGLAGSQLFEAVSINLLKGDLKNLFLLLEQIYSQGIELKRFANDLLLFFRSLIITRTCKDVEQILEVSDRELSELKKISADYSKETLYHYFQVLLSGIENLRNASQPRLHLEMTFIKAAQIGQIIPVTSLLDKIDNLLEGCEVEGVSPHPIKEPIIPEMPKITRPPQPAKTPIEEPLAKPAEKIIVPKAPVEPDPIAKEETKIKNQAPTNPLPIPDKTTEPEIVRTKEKREEQPPPILHPRQKDVRKYWEEFIKYVGDRKKWMAAALTLSYSAKETENKTLIIRFNDPTECSLLQKSENKKLLTEFTQDFFQKELKIKLQIRDEHSSNDSSGASSVPRKERRALANDPLVIIATEIFNGQISGIRTGPRSR
jgi:DNA polymerase III subunit gamma/tau